MEKEVYIDSNILIFAATNNEKEGIKAKLFLKLLVEKNIKAYTSTLTFDDWFLDKLIRL